jgi:D-threo-aldose 1-dehydrogenase
VSDLRRVTLPGIPLTTTAIGFGCSNLLGDKTPEEGLRLLHVAYDAGVRHFDVARYYGFGDAEGLVGQFSRGKRDQITITTKFGLQPLKQAAQSKRVVRLVRRMARASPLVRNLVRRRISAVVQKGRFDVHSARESLETSLRELQTDYIDLYLLHECEPQDCQPDLLEFLQQARAAGKIRSFGAGTGFVRAERVCAQAPAFTEIVQFESSILAPNVGKIPRTDPRLDSGQRAIITHGLFAPAVPLCERIRTDPAFARRFTEAFGVDGSD